MRFQHLFLAPLIASVFWQAGCNEKTPPTNSPPVEPNQQTSTVTANDAPIENAVKIDVVTYKELQAILAAPSDKLLVCDYWSTSCDPCMDEFPKLIALHTKYGADKLTCVSASLDYDGLPDIPIEKCRETALAFLTKQKATFKNVLVGEEIIDVLGKMDAGSIPIVEVYKNGTLLKRFSVEGDDEHIYDKQVIPFIESHLAGK